MLNVILFILSFIWQLPQNLIAILMMPFIAPLRKISYKKLCICYEGKFMNGGISLGNFSFVSPNLAKNEASIAHEQEGHSWDSKLFGPLYLFVIGLPSIVWAMYRRGHIEKYPNYYSFYTEKWANKHADLIVEETINHKFIVKKRAC